jgi:hypothetical protein
MRVVFLFVLHSIRTLHVPETFLLFQQQWAKLELQRDFGAVDGFVAALVAVSNFIPVNRKLMWEHGVLRILTLCLKLSHRSQCGSITNKTFVYFQLDGALKICIKVYI